MPPPEGTAHPVSLTGGEPGHVDGKLIYLILEQHHAESSFQCPLLHRVVVGDRLSLAIAEYFIGIINFKLILNYGESPRAFVRTIFLVESILIDKPGYVKINSMTLVKPDAIDEKLIHLLSQDARQSSEALAKQLKLSAATVRRRMRKLIQDGLLHIIGVADPAKFGFPVTAVFAVDADHDVLESTMHTLVLEPEIRWAATTTGRFDIIAVARFRSNELLSEFMSKKLTKIQGIKDVETFLCLEVNKGRLVPFIMW